MYLNAQTDTLFIICILSLISSSVGVNYSCTPTQPCWPSLNDWDALNSTINGRLQATIPYARPCFGLTTGGLIGGTYDQDQCDHVKQHYTDSPLLGTSGELVGNARASVYGAAANLQWEARGNSNCFLESIAPGLPPLLRRCALGQLSPFYVNASDVTHVQAAITFCRKNNIRLSIKNTGSDFLGRSFSGDSLALWTHHIDTLEYYPTYTAKNCAGHASYRNIGVIGAGVTANEAYAYFEGHGMQVTGGAVPSVGLAGGFGQGGGHGVFGPKYGLMVDQAVEFDVVTADGAFRTINQCNDPDLFYAMRGGGGGTYAVLINYKFQLYPAHPINLHAFQATFPQQDIQQSVILREILTIIATNQTIFSNAGVAGYNFLYPSSIALYQALPESPDGADGMDFFKELTKEYYEALMSYPGISITENEYYHFSKYSDYLNYTIPIGVRHTPVGYGEALAGRLIPDTLFETPSSIEDLVSKFLEGMSKAFSLLNYLKPVAAQIYATTPVRNSDNSKTGVNPAFRGSLWSVVLATGWTNLIPSWAQTNLQEQVHLAMDPLREITPGGGCYMNEADYLEVDWQTAFFGSNYNRLLEIKRQYDPTNFFNCWKCVGWNNSVV